MGKAVGVMDIKMKKRLKGTGGIGNVELSSDLGKGIHLEGKEMYVVRDWERTKFTLSRPPRWSRLG